MDLSIINDLRNSLGLEAMEVDIHTPTSDETTTVLDTSGKYITINDEGEAEVTQAHEAMQDARGDLITLTTTQQSLEALYVGLEASLETGGITPLTVNPINAMINYQVSHLGFESKDIQLSLESIANDPAQATMVSMERIGGLIGAIGDNISMVLSKMAGSIVAMVSGISKLGESIKKDVATIRSQAAQAQKSTPIEIGGAISKYLSNKPGATVNAASYIKELTHTFSDTNTIVDAYNNTQVLNEMCDTILNGLMGKQISLDKSKFIKFVTASKAIINKPYVGYNGHVGIEATRSDDYLGGMVFIRNSPDYNMCKQMLTNPSLYGSDPMQAKVKYREFLTTWGYVWRTFLSVWFLGGLFGSGMLLGSGAAIASAGTEITKAVAAAGAAGAIAGGAGMVFNGFFVYQNMSSLISGKKVTKMATPEEMTMCGSQQFLKTLSDTKPTQIDSLTEKDIIKVADILDKQADYIIAYGRNLKQKQNVENNIKRIAKEKIKVDEGKRSIASAAFTFTNEWLQNTLNFEMDALRYNVNLMKAGVTYMQRSIKA